MAKKIKRKSASAKSPAPPMPPRREAMERIMADLHRVLEDQEFESLDEANKFLQNMQGQVPRSPARSPVEEAQHLAWDAWEAPTPQQAAMRAKQALAISADCADAYNVLAQVEARTIEEAYDFYRKGFEVGERSLGAEFFRENKGHFWGMLETRPYMRARQGLAECLWGLGRQDEAIGHYEALLELNPNDNQGIRDVLLGCYLRRGDDIGASRLYDQYGDDATAFFVWTRVLVEFRRGNLDAAGKALRAAVKHNPHVLGFLTGRKKLPRRQPDSYGFGDENEAAIYMSLFAQAWLATPEALGWMVQQVEKAGKAEGRLSGS